MPEKRDPAGASQATIKRLFAHSGNRCAFPRCMVDLVHGATVVGEICHIKAASPSGPRYDPQQTAEERHSYDNLVVLCGTHHTIIDNDPEAYTVERLVKMKVDHEGRSAALTEEEVDAGTRLFVDQAVRSANQSGGITAHTIHQTFNVQAPPIDPDAEDQRSVEKLRRQSEARRYLAPELARTIDRVLYIHGRAIPNFICASTESDIKPNDRKEDFIPHWPSLYPNAPQFSDLAADDATALIAFYDSLHSLADFVTDWWEREGQLPVNIFNGILHQADTSLRLALICVARFGLEKRYLQPFGWEAFPSSIDRSLAIADDARKHHIARFQAKAATKTPPPPRER
jgi:hypothetical protein